MEKCPICDSVFESITIQTCETCTYPRPTSEEEGDGREIMMVRQVYVMAKKNGEDKISSLSSFDGEVQFDPESIQNVLYRKTNDTDKFPPVFSNNIEDEISNLRLASGIGHALAILIAGWGAYVIYSEFHKSFTSISEIILRVSFLVMINVIAYSLFSLAKFSRHQIQHLINERSNFELKTVALKTAIALKNGDILKDILMELAKTERNFVIGKNKTTVDIEKLRLENDTSINVLQSIKENVFKILEHLPINKK